ncbi:TPM domain-containing protein [Bifidobacterium moraviense]|uniref:TPM domain-containing protein n=1 Tax=Bifidobacterium moraviense TaxID=2675323 RepID=UPI00145DD98C|nr:TPM domain-containing protein [Bifidobacterium sp. DSM 109958]
MVECAPIGAGMACRGARSTTGVPSGRLAALIGALLATVLVLGMPAGAAFADDPTPAATTSAAADTSASASASSDGGQTEITVTDSITDTENLLGGDVAAVTDAIDATRRDTGVIVKLMYLPKFMEGVDPEQWASQALESTQPEPNTVLLAVATQDGNLVVAVSSNSDEWLRKKSTVDKLSEAAVGPILANQSDPDWAGSAQGMMQAIATAKKTSVSSTATTIGVVAVGAGLVVVIGVCVAVYVIHRRRGRRHAGRRAGLRGRGRGTSASARRTGASSGSGRHRRHASAPASRRRSAQPTKTPDDIQETSSLGDHSGNHEQAN